MVMEGKTVKRGVERITVIEICYVLSYHLKLLKTLLTNIVCQLETM
jgi:hypothetical protein